MRKQDWSPRNESDNAYENWAAKIGLTARVDQVDANPWMTAETPEDERWAKEASHWKLMLKLRGKRLPTYFSQGAAHTEPPEIQDLLQSLALDAAGVENNPTFEEWAREYGYDEDSRKAEKSYNLTRKIAASLRKFLGDEFYRELLWDMEKYGEVG